MEAVGHQLPPQAPFLGSHLMQQQQLQQQALQQSSLNPAARAYQQGSSYSLPAMPQPGMPHLMPQQQQQQQPGYQSPLGPQQLLHPPGVVDYSQGYPQSYPQDYPQAATGNLPQMPLQFDPVQGAPLVPAPPPGPFYQSQLGPAALAGETDTTCAITCHPLLCRGHQGTYLRNSELMCSTQSVALKTPPNPPLGSMKNGRC